MDFTRQAGIDKMQKFFDDREINSTKDVISISARDAR